MCVSRFVAARRLRWPSGAGNVLSWALHALLLRLRPETRDQLVEKTGVLHLLRTPPVLMGEYGDSAKIVISWDFIGQVGLVH